MVGALARVTTNGRQLSRDALGSLQRVRSLIEKRDALSNNVAQAVEIVDLLTRVRELCLSLLERYPLDLKPKGRARESGEGIGLVEAPRGTLIHHYRVENGKVSWANILTPTALHLASMEEQVMYTAKALAGKDPDEVRPLLEIIPRAYDPCISCSVH
jgi:sulfhydrogenase subunit alpha